jgi:hypothetical protein
MSDHDEIEDAVSSDLEEHDDEVDADELADPVIPAIEEPEEL